MDEHQRREWLRRRDSSLRQQFALIVVALAALLLFPQSLTGPVWRFFLPYVAGPMIAAYVLIILVAVFSPAHASRTWFLWPPHRLIAIAVLWFAWIAFCVSIVRGASAHGRWEAGRDLSFLLIFAVGAVSLIARWLVPYLATRARRASALNVGSASEGDAGRPSPSPHGFHELILPLSVAVYCASAAAVLACRLCAPQLRLAPDTSAAIHAVAGNLAAVGALLVTFTPRPLPTDPWQTRLLGRGYSWMLNIAGGAWIAMPGARLWLVPTALPPAEAALCALLGPVVIWLANRMLGATAYPNGPQPSR